MTLWQFKLKKLGLTPRYDHYLVSSKKDGLEILMADDLIGLHNALTSLAGEYKPGDVVSTPEGRSIVLSPWKRQAAD